LARGLSKLGFCSRSQAAELIAGGRVRVNGTVRRDPEFKTDWQHDQIAVDDQLVGAATRVYVMLNKPRGLVTTTADEQDRATVLKCVEGRGWPRLMPVGRLDKASEGLLLLTNDSGWASKITDPATHLEKVYHAQINTLGTKELLRKLSAGALCEGEMLRVKRAALLRSGEKHSWLEIVLEEGRNRHIRRLLAAFGVEVLRLVRVSIGSLPLGDLPKGHARELTPAEVRSLAGRHNPQR
jgi:23S rRNA pseudouridine2605 synthase